MWAEYVHHITLHFPIVLTIVVAAVGLWSLRDSSPQLRTFIRFAGWASFAFATLAVISGLVAAPGWFGGEGTEGLAHHRNLGLTVWVVTGIAASSYELGVRQDVDKLRSFAVGVWCVAVFGVVGAGHWGGSELHTDKVPWLEEAEDAQSKDAPRD